MLTRIMADELKALIDKWTVPEKSPDVEEFATKIFTAAREEKIKDETKDFYVVQRSDGLFWGGYLAEWCPQVAKSMGFSTEGRAYLFHADYFNSGIPRKDCLKVLTYKEACECEGKSF